MKENLSYVDNLKKLVELETKLKRKSKSERFCKRMKKEIEQFSPEKQQHVMSLINKEIRMEKKKVKK